MFAFRQHKKKLQTNIYNRKMGLVLFLSFQSFVLYYCIIMMMMMMILYVKVCMKKSSFVLISLSEKRKLYFKNETKSNAKLLNCHISYFWPTWIKYLLIWIIYSLCFYFFCFLLLNGNWFKFRIKTLAGNFVK